ncbi:Protein IMPAIRED IN BABA-INDUCED STERILITY 1, partial [Mucuna pruriens]
MGCINSKNAVAGALSPSPAMVDIAETVPASTRDHSGLHGYEPKTGSEDERNNKFKKNSSKKSGGSFNFRLGLAQRHVEAEQNAAGWPPWLTAAAAEAIQGWIPLKADSFQKLEKVLYYYVFISIGQGTYSSVFRAREVESGKMYALKKVRFDNFQPESIRFMAREITILRRLDHPNIMKLEGIITSRLSSSIYLVFEYMEHDLAGLVSRPDIVFTESQIKCYMRQLLSGLEHCHMRGIMHRDIKVSNILLNNEGVLKIGDFGLANTISTNNKHQLTSRVVTLWYRPPELLMGSTTYGVSVDLWSVGCVFAELFLGKPILKGRTEVEQLHKIFKLCGSPPEEFWKKTKLPHATMFKPQTNYETSLRERCADFPATAVDLLEILLSIDANNRGTASSALMSEYFSTKPFACSPSILPKYPPSKEMDVKSRDDSSRKKTGGNKMREVATSRRQQRWVGKVLQEPNNVGKSTSKEDMQNIYENAHRDEGKTLLTKGKGGGMYKEHTKPPLDAMSEASQMVNVANGNGYSVPVQVQGSTDAFTWAKRRKQDASSTLSDGSRSKISALDPHFAKGTYDLTNQRVSMDFDPAELINAQGDRDEYGMRRAVRKSRFGRGK